MEGLVIAAGLQETLCGGMLLQAADSAIRSLPGTDAKNGSLIAKFPLYLNIINKVSVALV